MGTIKIDRDWQIVIRPTINRHVVSYAT